MEVIETIEIRQPRLSEAARGEDHVGGDDLSTVSCLESPATEHLVEVDRRHVEAEAKVVAEVMISRHAAQVAEELRL